MKKKNKNINRLGTDKSKVWIKKQIIKTERKTWVIKDYDSWKLWHDSLGSWGRKKYPVWIDVKSFMPRGLKQHQTLKFKDRQKEYTKTDNYKAKRNEYRAKNKDKINEQSRENYANKNETKRVKANKYYSLIKDTYNHKVSVIKSTFKISQKSAEKLYTEIYNGGKCKVCSMTNKQHIETYGTRLHIDHCHKTGKVNGILCQDCNVAKGILRDDPKRILALAKFTKKTQGEKKYE